MTAKCPARTNSAVNCHEESPLGTLLPWQCAHGQLLPLPTALAVTGVYKLYRNKKIVYVGAALNIRRRLMEHRQSSLRFDVVEFVEILDRGRRVEIERWLIRLHRPQWNNKGNPIQPEFTLEDIIAKLGDREGVPNSTLADELWESDGMTRATFFALIRPMKYDLRRAQLQFHEFRSP